MAALRWMLGFWTLGCTAELDDVRSATEAVELDSRGDGYYDVALAPGGPYGAAVRATGTAFVTALNASGAPRFASDGTPIRITCGATFIAPGYAITAGHCVDAGDVPDPATHPVTVQTYHLTSSVPWESAANLTGTFPAFSHPTLTSAQGYVVRRHTCTVERRCGTANGPQIDCDEPLADTALLRCPSLPGCTTGYLDVANTDHLDRPVDMVWTHEVYDIPAAASDSRNMHYTQYSPGVFEQNFHYFGNDRNQLLPLIAQPFRNIHGDYVPHSKLELGVSAGREARLTDLIGCHGTSGSNALQYRLTHNDFAILGPASWANGVSTRLCHPPTFAIPGAPWLGYSPLEYTQAAAEGVCAEAESCGGAGDPENVLAWLACSVAHIPEASVTWAEWPDPWPCARCVPWEQLRVSNEPIAELPRGGRLSIPGETYTAGQTYRFSLRVIPPASGGAAINVRLGATTIVHRGRPAFVAGERAGVITASFTPAVTGPQTLQIEVDPSSGGSLYVTEIVVLRNGATNTFDRHDFRAGAGLVDGTGTVSPMRFTGDGRGGYAALLEGGERMVLTRQALAAGRTYDVAFTGDRDQTLRCGLAHGNGVEVSAPCDVRAGRATLRLTAAAGQVPVALFVDAPAGAAPVGIDDLQIR
jgi:hypothetical protein